MPGPEANAEYHAVALATLADVSEIADDNAVEDGRNDVVAIEEAAPVRIRRTVQRLVVQQLRCPLGRVDLRDLGGDDEPCNLEELVRRHVTVSDHGVGSSGVAQTAIRVRCSRGLSAKRVDECVVLAREQVVEKARADRPVVGERRRFLPGPLRLDRIARRRTAAGSRGALPVARTIISPRRIVADRA